MPRLMFLDVSVKGKIHIAIFLCQVLTGFLHQTVTVYRPMLSTVLMGCYTEKSLVFSKYLRRPSILEQYPTDQDCCREISLKKWNLS